MIGEGKSRADRLWELRAAALGAWGNMLAHPDIDLSARVNFEKAAAYSANLADAMMAECDRRDLEAKKANR